MLNGKSIYSKLEESIINARDIPEGDKSNLLRNIADMKNDKLNILITGATGAGKSSTINALFETEVAKVGVGVDPETMDIERYELGNMILWDSPGLGDGKEADNRHAKNIIKKLNDVDKDGNALIDLVLVILDGSSRDMGTSYQLINEVIIPNMGEHENQRLLVAINQADAAMKGRFWDFDKNEPQPQLVTFLNEKAASVKKRIKEATGVDVDPVYYSAGFKEEGVMQQAPYNLSKLMYLIVQATPEKKRAIYVDTTNKDPEMWKKDDGLVEYREETKKSVVKSVIKAVGGAYTGYRTGTAVGAAIGGAIGGPAGAAIGGVVGGVIGAVGGFFSSLF